MGFKKDFMWGAATASYQIEGAAYEDGKGLSIWDVFCKQPGKVHEGHTGDTACDHYHRFKEDIALMKEMGIKSYRFSVSWPRIMPNGTGEVNEAGLAFYDALVDELLAADIIPYMTLFHWDLPYALHQRGGWMNPESPKWFEAYAKVLVERLGDRVKHYVTFNEPQCFIGLGHSVGLHAPGLKQSNYDLLQMAHHVLLAHGHAVRAIRKYAKGEVQVGWAPTGSMHYPATYQGLEASQEVVSLGGEKYRVEDIEAARKGMFSTHQASNEWWPWSITWWSDPIFLGKYPEDAMGQFAEIMKDIVKPGDMEIISTPIDFLGQNIYNGREVKAGAKGEIEYIKRPDGHGKTALNWPITPEALYWAPKFLYERYGKPIHITENGLACHDVVSLDGKVHDPNRMDFLHRYLKALKKAVEDGVPIDAYFQWSLMDNFEWHSGYAERFGIVYVDYVTQERTIKDSGYWYKEVISQNGESI